MRRSTQTGYVASRSRREEIGSKMVLSVSSLGTHLTDYGTDRAIRIKSATASRSLSPGATSTPLDKSIPSG
jgi:hypothetical protein